MKFKLFFTILMLTIINQSFSMFPGGQQNLNNQLLLAVRDNNNAAVASLLQAGADINSRESLFGTTPLHFAAVRGHTATVALLLSKGADINAKDNFHKKTPLHEAARFGRTATVELLLSHSAHINAKDGDHYIPLHWAAELGDAATVELLLSHGADINAKDDFNGTPLRTAAMKGHRRIVTLLKNYQALLEQAKKPTKELLKVAIESGYYSLVKLLLQRGLKPEISDLKLAKEKWQAAEYKQSYKATGRLLVAYLQLIGELKAPESNENSQAMSTLNRLMAYFRFSVPRPSMQGPISKTGIGMPETIAQRIATFLK